MASTCRDVITLALRVGKVAGISGTPTGAEALLGLEALQSFYLDLVSGGMFGRLKDVEASAAYTAKPGERVRAHGSAAVTLPDLIQRNACDPKQLPPYDLSLVEVVDLDAGSRTLKLYEAALGGWSDLAGLTLDSPAPLVTRGAMGLAATFATSAAFLVCFTAALDANLVPAVRAFRLSLLRRGSSEQPDRSDGYC